MISSISRWKDDFTKITNCIQHRGCAKIEILEYLSTQGYSYRATHNVANIAMSVLIKEDIQEEKKQLLVGLALSLFGLGVSFITYINAKQGDTYIVTYGIVVYGVFIIGKSLLEIWDLKEKETKWKNITLNKK